MIKAKLVELSSKDGLNFATFKNEVQSFYMLATDIDESIQEVLLDFKASDCVLSRTQLECSIQNSLEVVVKSIDTQDICTVIEVQNSFTTFEAVLPTHSFKRLDFKEGESIYAYIKANSLFIEEVLC